MVAAVEYRSLTVTAHGIGAVRRKHVCPACSPANRPRSEPEQPDRVLFENERPHFVFDRDLFEIGQPAVGRQQRIVRAEQHLVLQ